MRFAQMNLTSGYRNDLHSPHRHPNPDAPRRSPYLGLFLLMGLWSLRRHRVDTFDRDHLGFVPGWAMNLVMHTKMYCTINVDGVACPVTNMFDIDGNELTEDATLEHVASIVALLPNGHWYVTETDYTELRPLQ